MIDARIFRKINKIEINIIANSVRKISTKLLPVLDTLNRFLYILINKSPSEKIFPKIYLITNEQQKVIKESNITNKIYSAGLYFGFIKKGDFYFSIEASEHLYKSGIFTDFKLLIIDNGGEKSILYGNNILKKMVIKHPINLKKKDFLIVLNEVHEIIGLGLSHVSSELILSLKPNDIFAINVSDKGQYLRAQ